jgi:class 3 adenylate cyclase
MTDLAAWEAAGLYDPNAPDAGERAELLAYIENLGLTIEQIAAADRAGTFGSLVRDRVLWNDTGPQLTLADLATRAGMDRERVRAVVRANGEPDVLDVPLFRDAHVELLQSFGVGAEIFGVDAVLQFSRVLAACAARVADAAVGLFFTNVSPEVRGEQLNDSGVTVSSLNAVSAFGVVPGIMDVLLRDHFITAARRVGLIDIAEGGAMSVTIAFVDLVASTELSRATSSAEWSTAVAAFERAADDAAAENDGRVVKFIGDEVMLIAPTAGAAAAVVRDVMRVVDDHPVLGTARAGVASGVAVPRDGDYFGPVVNLAARLVAVAHDGEVLVNDAAGEALRRDGYRVVPAGSYQLKGFDEPVPALRVVTR